MIALRDYFIRMTGDIFLKFYGEQDLKSINKPITSLFMKLCTVNF